MHNEGDTDKRVYALYLNQESTGWIAAENSTLNFGNLNITRFSEATSFTYVSADLSAATWKVPVTKPALGGTAITESSKTGLLSTTQSKLTVPSKVYTAMYDDICGSWFRTCITRDHDILWNCTETSQSYFDDLTFTVGGMQVIMTAYEYTARSNYRTDYCKLQFKEGDNWVLGTAFLSKFYTVFDFEQQRVGFAAAKHESEMATWLIVMIVIVLLLALGCCVGACIFVVVKKNKENRELSQPLLH